MIWLLFFFHRSPYFSEQSYFDTIKGSINLKPFSTMNRYLNALKNGRLIDIALINLLGNILIFIPLGILLPTLWKQLDTFLNCTVSCFGLILMVEITQLFTTRGSCDIDDLILNLIGCMIGYAIHAGASKTSPSGEKLSAEG